VVLYEGLWNNRDPWFSDSEGYLKNPNLPAQTQILSCEENPRVIIFLLKEIKRK